MPYLHCISSFAVLVKILRYNHQFWFPVVLHYLLQQLMSILELHSTISERKKKKKKKRIFIMDFPFLTNSFKLPQFLNDQKLLSAMKAFCWCSLKELVAACFIKEVPPKLEVQFKKGVYFSFNFCWYFI